MRHFGSLAFLSLWLLALGCEEEKKPAPELDLIQDEQDLTELSELDQDEIGELETEGVDELDQTGQMSPDEELVRALIAGQSLPSDVFYSVNWSEGFPVACANGKTLFVHWYDGGSWSFSGDANGWELTPMQASDGFHWLELEVATPAGSRYKFVKDGVDYVADPWARHHDYDENGEISLLQPTAQQAHFQRFNGLQDQGLRERSLRIYVPGGTGPWPVMYMHDGQNLFAPDAVWGGWKVQDTLEALEAEVLVVGLDNTEDRMVEYTHVDDELDGQRFTARGDDYAKLVMERVRPFVESSYPTTELDGVMGSSLGGLISLYIAHLYPDELDFVASLSGTLRWGKFELDNLLMQQLYEQAGRRDFVIYVDSGGGPGSGGCVDLDGDGYFDDDAESRDNYCQNRQFADGMAALGYVWEEDLFHWHEEGAEHTEAAWAARLHLPFGVFLGLR
ncbi:MAG: alpha/beta hydrolase-fold protein [Myxococcota bacterium]|jgi:predicted alpha/beta superfamily hydrolase|nr:alpha/beta hydrolase-fold protein [Myxococcota bacterium]